jgi:hypothetical protein
MSNIKRHIVAINRLMLPLIATVGTFSDDEQDMNMFKMHVGDVAHNVAALDVFNHNLDAVALHDSIMMQDTLPREHFYAVLKYIEDNALIPESMYACS